MIISLVLQNSGERADNADVTDDELLERIKHDRGLYPQIARESGVKYTTLTKIACGQVKRPYRQTLDRIAAYYARVDKSA